MNEINSINNSYLEEIRKINTYLSSFFVTMLVGTISITGIARSIGED